MSRRSATIGMLFWSFIVLCAVAAEANSASECEFNCAANRNDVLSILTAIESNWPEAEAKVWVNSNEPDPVVSVGDRVAYTMTTQTPAYYTLVYIDSKGYTTVLKPDGMQQNGYDFPSRYSIYPALTDQCLKFENKAACFDPSDFIDQADPVGRDTVMLIASDAALENSVFTIRENSDFVELGRSLDRINSIQQSIKKAMSTIKIDIYRYSYTVEADTQYTTRAIRRKITDMEAAAVASSDSSAVVTASTGAEPVGSDATVTANQPDNQEALVFNNINFEYNSFDLLPGARRELDALGSVLVDRQLEGDMPLVALTGHTDSIGPEAYNMQLSEKRAKAVKTYLESEHGITERNLFSDGAGESSPMMPNDSEWGRSQNRRVELSIIVR